MNKEFVVYRSYFTHIFDDSGFVDRLAHAAMLQWHVEGDFYRRMTQVSSTDFPSWYFARCRSVELNLLPFCVTGRQCITI
jgi:hypothetical protein